MARYEANPSKDTAGIPVLPKDMYEFIIGEAKAFEGKNKEGKDNYGVRYSLKVDGGAMDGKRIPQTIYQHSEGARNMGKGFLMAALGYKKNTEEEERFNTEQENKDWSFDGATGEVGDGWSQLTGQRVIGNFDVKKGDNDVEQQDIKGWLPVE